MDLRKSWVIARKDIFILKGRRNLLGMMIGFPAGLGIALPLIIYHLITKSHSVVYTESFESTFLFF